MKSVVGKGTPFVLTFPTKGSSRILQVHAVLLKRCDRRLKTINLKGEKASLQGRFSLMLRNTLRVIDEANKALYLAKLKAETELFFPLKFFYEQYVLSSFFPFHSLPLLTNTPPYFKMHQYQKNEQVIMNLIL